ncbi:MAG: rhodanese-like domain-containing protein [Polyangia bacterium]
MRLGRIGLVLAAVVVVGAAIGLGLRPLGLALLRYGVRARFPDVRPISTAELAAWRADAARVQPLVLDVREPAEFAVSHLAGSRSLPLSQAGPSALADTPRDRPIVVYCSVGLRSAMAARALQRGGFTRVQNLEGSIFQWANESRPLVRPDGSPADTVHPYDARWGRLLVPARRAPLR